VSWPMEKLGDLVRAHYGKALKKEDRKEHGQFGVFGSSGNIGFHDDYVVDYPTLIVGRKGSVGHIVWAPDGGWVIDTAYFLQINEPAQLDLRYLFYALKRANLASKTITTSIPGLNRDDLYDSEIPLPPLAEQKRIAAILDKADAIRRKRQQAIQLADDFLRAVFLGMFGDPITNPKGWEVKPLGEITSFENGDRSSNYPSGDDIVNSGVLFLSTKNIVADSLDLRHKQFITEDKYNQLSRGKARKGDLIITLRGTLGACCIFDCEYEKAFINAQMMIIRPAKELVVGFLHDFLVTESIKSHFQRIGQGAAVPQLTAKQFKELLIPLPTLELQLKYETIRRFVLATIVRLSGGEEQDFFNSLSQKAFSGQL
jgi:type I restriction enzyme S subunit